MADYAAAVERAQSRAAVLQSLQASYGSGKANNAVTKSNPASNSQKNASSNQLKKGLTNAPKSAEPSASAVNNSDKGVVNEMVDVLMSALGDQTMKSKQFFKDSLRGKAIVVENVKAQLDASKASKRIELAGKRKRTVSNRALKRLHVASPTELPSDTEISALHDLWWEYAQQLMSNCHSEAQLQARLHSMECVGARVYVLDSTTPSLIGTVGIVTAVSKNCFFVAVDHDRDSTSTSVVHTTASSGKADLNVVTSAVGTVHSTNNTANSTNNTIKTTPTTTTPTSVALPLVKATTTLGVVLPALHSKHRPHTLFSDDTELATNTHLNSSSGHSSVHTSNGNNDDKSPPFVSGEVGLNAITTASAGFKFDRNEREAGGRICVLYGKHFMPHCKYD